MERATLIRTCYRTLVAASVVIGLVSNAQASIVVPNSSYDVAIYDTSGDGIAIATLSANGSAQSFTYNGVSVTVTESESYQGAGAYRINFEFSASQDLFPTTGSGTGGYVNIGGTNNPLQLTSGFDLTDAILTFKTGSGSVYNTSDTISLIQNPSPWDGYYNKPSAGVGYVGSTGQDIQTIDLQLDGVAIPEPSSFVLLGAVTASAAGAMGWRRRKIAAPWLNKHLKTSDKELAAEAMV